MIFRQLFDGASSTYSYLLADEASRQAVIIDSVDTMVARDLQLLQELQLTLVYSLETHVHADHVTGGGLLRENTGCKTALSVHAGVDCADRQLKQGDCIEIGDMALQVIETPGHTDGCISFYGLGRVFTGDALLIRGCGRTDFQSGDAGLLYESITQKIFSLPDSTLVYPGHDYRGFTVSTIAEERLLNPRLQLDQLAFIVHMNDLELDNPRKMDIALPANLACGMRK